MVGEDYRTQAYLNYGKYLAYQIRSEDGVEEMK